QRLIATVDTYRIQAKARRYQAAQGFRVHRITDYGEMPQAALHVDARDRCRRHPVVGEAQGLARSAGKRDGRPRGRSGAALDVMHGSILAVVLALSSLA